MALEPTRWSQLRLEKWLLVYATVSSLLVLYLAAPIVMVLLLGSSPSEWSYLLVNPVTASEARAAIATTLLAASASTLLLVLLGTPLAYLLARRRFPGRTLLEALIDVPLVLPHAVAGVAILAAYGSPDLSPLAALVRSTGVKIVDSFLGVVAVMLFVSAPLYIDAAKAGFASVDPRLEAVARSLGASPLVVFRTVTLPLAARSLVAGAILAWARAVSEVGALLVVAYYPRTVGVLVLEWVESLGLKPALALSAAMVLLTLAVLAALNVVARSTYSTEAWEPWLESRL